MAAPDVATVLTDRPSPHFLRVQRFHLDRFREALRDATTAAQVVGTPVQLDRAYRVQLAMPREQVTKVDGVLRRLRSRGGHALDWDWRAEHDEGGGQTTTRTVMLRFADERPPYDRMLAAVLRVCCLALLFGVLHVIHPDLYWPHEHASGK